MQNGGFQTGDEGRNRKGEEMNIYHCLTEELDFLEEYIEGYARYERGQILNLVAAPTRGKAKALFVQANKRDVEWTTHMNIRKVGSLECEAGVIPDDDTHEAAWDLWYAFTAEH